MNLELDHVFILVEPHAQVADLLVQLGLTESFSRAHKGQGTSNRRFEFTNAMLEFLWVRDKQEALNGPAKDLKFTQRATDITASPFGIIVKRKDNTNLNKPYSGFNYQPDYLKAPMSFYIGQNAKNIQEPLCIYAPFIDPNSNGIKQNNQTFESAEKSTFKKLSHVKIHICAQHMSDELQKVGQSDRLTVVLGQQHLIEVSFDELKCGLSKDFRPLIPLIIHW
ncbi:MAG: hypothetical protein HRU38_15100 [Saccharospirillaceae bacterium]|nr:VOC family protein [Pseudomonadales bacterium]NRB79969.1 hypothetical protein [Saccharospirillaceae bacterium]